MWYNLLFPFSCTSCTTNYYSVVFTYEVLCRKPKVLVNAPTIPVLTKNSWLIHLPKKGKKKTLSLSSFSPSLPLYPSLSLYKCLYRLKDSSLQTRGHHRSLRYQRRFRTTATLCFETFENSSRKIKCFTNLV